MPRILIIEDDEKLREELKIFLNKNGYEATALTTFDNTINDILKINPDLILLDINLPNTDGEYICKEIRKKSNMPIIIVTSRDNEIDELLSINNGADHYITKPVVRLFPGATQCIGIYVRVRRPVSRSDERWSIRGDRPLFPFVDFDKFVIQYRESIQ